MPWTTVEGWPGRVWIDKRGTRTFYLRSQRGGKRFDLTTRAHTLRAAMKELERFEVDPADYQPLGTEEKIAITEGLIERYAVWCGAATGSRDPRWLAAKRRYLKWWAAQLQGRSLKGLSLTFILDKAQGVPDRTKKIVALKHVYSWLRQTDQIAAADDPTLDALPVPPGKPSQDVFGSKVIPEADFRAVLPLLVEPIRDECVLMAATGCHLSEVKRFAETGTVETTPHGVVIGFQHKGGHLHRVLVSDHVAEAARRIRSRKPVARETTYRAIRTACTAANVATWTPGRFRATFASRAIEAGVTPDATALVLGHRSGATSLRWYASLAIPPRVKGLE